MAFPSSELERGFSLLMFPPGQKRREGSVVDQYTFGPRHHLRQHLRKVATLGGHP